MFDNEHTQLVHKHGRIFDNRHANQGSQCSSVPTYTLAVHNVALYRLYGAQDDFACSLSIFFDGVQCSVVSLGVCACGDRPIMTLDLLNRF